MSDIVLKIILIVAGSIFFPALGYYLDYKSKRNQKASKSKKSRV